MHSNWFIQSSYLIPTYLADGHKTHLSHDNDDYSNNTSNYELSFHEFYIMIITHRIPQKKKIIKMSYGTE